MSPLSKAVALVALTVGLAACATVETPRADPPARAGDSALPPAAPIEPGAPSPESRVKLEVEIPKSYFLKDQDVTVTIWNARELALRERFSRCYVSFDRSGKETMTCPPGVVYEEPKPETFKVTYAELGSSVILDVKSLALGERYDVSIGGSASDGCNHTAAGAQGVAVQKIVLRDLSFSTTEMACVDRVQ
ncbi:MAG: hypothetical protein U0414_41145 [Polyangiaceae bacterium]